jgi:hypothetical protein
MGNLSIIMMMIVKIKHLGIIYKITKISDLNTLIHEIKHFDRHLRKGPNTDMLSLGVMR